MRHLPTILGILVVLIICQPLHGQNKHHIDSLKRLLQGADSETITLDLLGDICWAYAVTRTNLDTARLYADSIKRFSEERNNEPGLAQSHFYYGVIDRFKSNNYDGLSHLEKFVTYFQHVGDSQKVAGGLFQAGVIHKNLGNFEESLSAFHRILKIHENENYQHGVGFTLNTIGSIQRTMEKYQDAIASYHRAISIFEKEAEEMDLRIAFVNLGNVYREIDLFDSAKYYYEEALAPSSEQIETEITPSVLENMGILYNKMGKHLEALEYHKKSLALREQRPAKVPLAVSLIKVGLTYLKIGEHSTAADYLERGLKVSLETNVKPEIMEAYQGLMELEASRGAFREAFEFQQLYNAIEDSVFSAEKVKQINELEAKYQTAQKDQEIVLLASENETHQAKAQRQTTLRNALIGGLFMLGIIGVLVFLQMTQRMKSQKLLAAKNEEIKVSNLKEQLQTLEMKALRAQMNPHFLFNSLNSINRMIKGQDNDNASIYLAKFSKLVRLMLENSEQSNVSLQDEILMLESYIQLESLRFKNKIDYEIAIAETIDKEDTLMPSMVLQPFVENAIWHGLMHKEKRGLLSIDIKETADHLQCRITDNGVGREESIKLREQSGFKKKSMGIQITAERLKLLTKQKVTEAIKIIDLKDDEDKALGTEVNISIPIS